MATAVPATADDLDILTRTGIGEADNQPALGAAGVLWVMRTRATWQALHGDHPEAGWWGTSLKDVCQHPHQFSCWNEGDPNLSRILTMFPADPDYQVMHAIARAVMAGEIDDPTDAATHYERLGAGARWAKGRPIKRIIGQHAFYVIGPGA